MLRFKHPLSGEILSFESPPPADMAGLIDGFRKIGGLALGQRPLQNRLSGRPKSRTTHEDVVSRTSPLPSKLVT
jgi:hypothetical protein